MSPFQSAGLFFGSLKRRGAHELGALETFSGQVLVLELEVLRAGLGEDRLAALVGEVDGLQRGAQETWTTSIGASATSASRIARFVASASTGSGRVRAWKRGAVSPRASACCCSLAMASPFSAWTMTSTPASLESCSTSKRSSSSV